MLKESIKWVGYLFYFIVLNISCAGTELTHTQTTADFKGQHVSNILVIAITGNEDSRRSFEQKIVAQFKTAGVAAISSEDAIPMPADLELKKEMLLNAVNQLKNDAVLITHLIYKNEKEAFARGGQGDGGFYSFYHARYLSSYARDPGFSRSSKTVYLETNLYDVKTEKLIWSGQSKTVSKDSKDQIIDDVIRVVINDLQNNKLISPK